MKQSSTPFQTEQHSTEYNHQWLFLLVSLLIICTLSSFSSTVTAQQSGIQIQGTVLDENGEALIGVTIIDKETKRGTITDLDGKFSIPVSNANTKLEISYMGYAGQTIVPGSQRMLNIKMVPSNLYLDEVVVVGFGSMKKRDLTGAVTSIKPTDITLLPTHNALEALQGKVPGMDIIRSSGKAGAGVNITIRGNRSINGNNSPLFVIDGIQGGSYSDINPGDIEAIEILKDASSTAIYGSEGANGVVIITTKKGKAGRTHVSYDGYYGINKPEYPASMMGDEWIQFIRESKRTVGQWSSPTDDESIFNADVWQAIQNNEWVDWLDLALQDGHQQNHSVSVSGGSENTTAFFSLTYFDEEGLISNDKMSRYSFRSNIDHKISKFASAGLNTQVTHRENNMRNSSIIPKAASSIPFGTPFDENNNVVRYPITGNSTALSPLLDETSPYTSVNQSLVNSAIVKAYLELRPFEGLIFRSNLATSFGASRSGQYFDSWSLTEIGVSSETKVNNSISRSFGWDNILTYNKELDDHSFGATLLSSWGKSQNEDYSMTGYDQTVPKQLFYAIGSTSTTGRLIESSYVGTERLAFGARLNYSYKGRYIFQATDRYEASSVLSIGNQWHHFPSVSAAWRINEEPFMDNFQNLNNLKLRFSYGQTGNSGSEPYEATYSGLLAGTLPLAFGETSASYYGFTQNIANTDLTWEKTANYNIGIDLGMWNRVNASLELYKTVTTDILLERLMPGSGGGEGFKMWQNVGTSENKGIEFSLQTMNVNKKNFKWNSEFTFYYNNEKITGLINGKDILIGSEKGNWLLGREITSYRTYEKLGIWQLGEEEAAAVYGCAPGDIKIKDQITVDTDADGTPDAPDGIINSSDWIYVGSPTPKYILGLSNTFVCKGFDLNIYMFARLGQTIDHQILGRYESSGGNFPAYFDYWTPENPTNDFPRPNANRQTKGYTGFTALNYIDGSYFKIKTLSLGYSLPKSVLKSCKIEKARIYLTASNLLNFTKSHLIKYYDPERGGAEEEPIGKTIVIGTNLTF